MNFDENDIIALTSTDHLEDTNLTNSNPSPRKRPKNIHSYSQNVNKEKRNSGKEYLSGSKIVQAKEFHNENCTCKKKCYNFICEEERKAIFDSFWKLANFDKQNILIHGLVQRLKVKRRKTLQKTSRKNNRFLYSVAKSGEKIKVCKSFFLKTFQISNGRLSRVLATNLTVSDGRGKQNASRRNIQEDLISCVRTHINSFPACLSHYVRSKHVEGRKYLNSDLDVTKMYRLYLLFCQTEKITPVKEWIYRKVFMTEFNLSFHPPRKDTCQTCDLLKIKLDSCENNIESTKLKEMHVAHLKNVELTYQTFKNDQLIAQQNPEFFYNFSFDLQKALPFPKLSVSIAYYKRNMYAYNLGFYNFSNKKSKMFFWDETVASRGSQEIGSCILKYCQGITTQRHIVAYSDACTGQNRNMNIALIWLTIVGSQHNTLEIIDHKFMVSGHSFLPNDRDFGVIENAVKKSLDIYVPEHYEEVIKRCKQKNKFFVKRMERKDFLSMEKLRESITRRTKDIEGENFSWLEIRWLRFYKDQTYKFYFKTSLDNDSDFRICDITPKSGRPKKFETIDLSNLYETNRKISKEKFSDMMDLLRFIPYSYRDYFISLEKLNETTETEKNK